MFKCRVCEMEFADWHALGGHMRKHTTKKRGIVRQRNGGDEKKELLGKAMAKLSELNPQEAWQIVVSWIMDVYRQVQLREDIIQTYRMRMQDTESKVEAVQNELKNLQQMIVREGVYKETDNQL